MPFAENELWRQILHCPVEGVNLPRDSFRRAKIDDFRVARVVQHEIYRFQVSVRDLLLVDGLQTYNSALSADCATPFPE